MRHYDIPYVPRGPGNYKPVKEVKDIYLFSEIKKFLCGKSMGRISECKECKAKCAYGIRAIEIVEGKAPKDENLVIEPGKTMIEMAKQANQENKIKEEKKDNKVVIRGWYDKAYNSPNPIEWIMSSYGIDEKEAKRKIACYVYLHPELKETKPLYEYPTRGRKAKAKQETVKPETTVKTNIPNDSGARSWLETKVSSLMKLQDEYKSKIAEYQKMYEDVKGKIDVILAAMDVLEK